MAESQAVTEFDDEERVDLLGELGENMSPTVWACLWVSNISILKEIGCNGPAKTPATTREPVRQPPHQREWDGRRKRELRFVAVPTGQCVLTKAGDFNQVAHIYPFCPGSRFTGPSRNLFWSSLRMFWTSEEVDNWKQAVLGEKGTEDCSNLITLSATAYIYWGKALFAIEPIQVSADRCRLEARFHWLKQFKHNGRINPIFRAQNIFPKDSVGKNIKLFNCVTDEKLCSGDLICFETSDPEELPLPSFTLLQMQWNLQRIAALSGAAEPNDEADPDDSDDDLIMQWNLQRMIAALSDEAEPNDEADPDDSGDDLSNAIYDVEMEDKQPRHPVQRENIPL
ncbi:hypothetical protein V8E54_013269 [Elaphomyces granulatus]